MNTAALVHAHKPWLKSTGPRTARGKSISCMNALKHGNRSAAVIAERRAVKHYLRVQKEFLKQIRLLLRYKRAGVSRKIIQEATNELVPPEYATLRIPIKNDIYTRMNTDRSHKFISAYQCSIRGFRETG